MNEKFLQLVRGLTTRMSALDHVGNHPMGNMGNIIRSNGMNERTKKLFEQATTWALDNYPPPVNTFMWEDLRNEKFAELIVRECAGVIHLESKDFVNGNCFADDALWKSVTTEYGKNRERGFDPIGMSIHFEKILKKHFGVEE